MKKSHKSISKKLLIASNALNRTATNLGLLGEAIGIRAVAKLFAYLAHRRENRALERLRVRFAPIMYRMNTPRPSAGSPTESAAHKEMYDALVAARQKITGPAIHDIRIVAQDQRIPD